MIAGRFFTKAHHLRMRRKLGLDRLDPSLGVQREGRRQVFGYRHSGNNANVERAFLIKDVPDIIVRLRPPKAEAIRRLAVLSAGLSELQIGMILPPRPSRFLIACETRMNKR